MEKSRFISACAQGGTALNKVLAELRQTHLQKLLHDVRRSLPGSHADMACDLVQETLIKVWRHCGRFRGEASVMTWLYSILRRAILDELRRLRPEVPLLDSAGEVPPEVEEALRDLAAGPPVDPSALAESADMQRLYASCFARFAAADPQAAAVVRWVAEDDLDIDEVAAILGRSPGATRTFLSQCRKKARLHLAPWYAQVRPSKQKLAA
ncbi:MAG: RNA polymerase sigma factor [Chitinophagaceae bacterium]|nr:RNA polymerase sigma factor [Rubrivivax sp.]